MIVRNFYSFNIPRFVCCPSYRRRSFLICFKAPQPHGKPAQVQAGREPGRAQLLEPSARASQGIVTLRIVCAMTLLINVTSQNQWAKENNLLLEAYSPLGSNKQVKETLQVPEVQAIAKELGITPAQAVISWHVQRGVCPILIPLLLS